MPTAKPTIRIHDAPSPVNHPMRFDLFVDTPYGPLDLCSIDAYIHQYDKGPTHDWIGQPKVGGKVVDRTRGAITMELPPIDRERPPEESSGRRMELLTKSNTPSGRPRATARDIAVYLAHDYFTLAGAKKPKDAVIDLWDAGTGFTDARAVSKKCENAEKFLKSTNIAKLAFGGATGDKDAAMVVLERGARVALLGSDKQRCVVRGPFWAWHYGEKEAKRFSDGSVEIHLKSEVPASWLALGR